MDYPCGKFGDCSFSRFGFIVRTNRHTDAASALLPRLSSAKVIIVTREDSNLFTKQHRDDDDDDDHHNNNINITSNISNIN